MGESLKTIEYAFYIVLLGPTQQNHYFNVFLIFLLNKYPRLLQALVLKRVGWSYSNDSGSVSLQ